MSRVVGVIPARLGATRFPGKPLALIQGLEMIRWVIRGAKASKLLSEVLVATDDEKIGQAAQKENVRFVMTDSRLPSGTDRIYAATKNENWDYVINIQGDEPLMQGSLIDSLIAPLLADKSLEMSTLSGPLPIEDVNNLNSVKVLMNLKSDAIYFSRFPIPFSRVAAEESSLEHLKQTVGKHIGMYGYRSDFLKLFCGTQPSRLEKLESLEQLRALELGARIRVVTTNEVSVGVDVPEDISRVEKILAEKL
ncbi:MAG: 3-deoxy-manno-octulosonate cytidylyltransferase [Pseudobdellovibrionaceae bacterium]|jgi:3-deoxy-manno-octulosonate cytidylyltransferase (CMP-KDO synthetase)